MDLCVVGAGVVALVLSARPGDPPVVLDIALATATCLPWLWRARFPLATLVASGVGLVTCVLVFRPYDTATVIAAILLFSVALTGDRRRSLVVGR